MKKIKVLKKSCILIEIFRFKGKVKNYKTKKKREKI